MNTRFQYIILLVLVSAFMSCEKDNYEEPKSTLNGRIVYKGEALNFEYNRVNYELYQSGFGKTGPIGSTFTPEGGFSQVLFDGNYKLVVPAGQGPFIWKQNSAGKPDSVAITLNGSANLDIEVMPYFMIRASQLTYASGKVTGTCKLEKVVTDANAKAVERLTLYVSKLQFADSQTNIATTNLAGSAITDLNNISLSATVPTLVPTQNYVFARIGLKLSGVDDMIFGPTVKLSF